MTYALDTNIASKMLAGDQKARGRWRQEERYGNRCVIPLMVYYETKRGLLASNATNKLAEFEKLCEIMGVSDMTIEDADAASRVYAWRKRRGRPVGDSDILIAAQCIARRYTLVTNNTKDFSGAEEAGALELEDWTV